MSSRGGPLVLIHPPALSRRYLKTKFLPYGMGVLASSLRARHVPVVQYDFLMDYLYEALGLVDVHDPATAFSDDEYFAFLTGQSAHAGLAAFARRYRDKILPGASVHAFSIVAYPQFWASLLLARAVKRRDPESIVVFGGPFVTLAPTEHLTRAGVADHWVRGDGAQALHLLYRRHGLGEDVSLAEIPGLVARQGGAVLENRPARRAAADEGPPDFGDLTLDDYRFDHRRTGPGTLFLPYRTSTGCASHCSFCTGRLVAPFATKPADKVVREMRALAEICGSSAFMLCDSAVNNDPRLLALLCRRLADEMPDLAWYGYARVKDFGPELLRAARRAGCFGLFWGAEAASQPVVDLLGKGFATAELSQTLARAVDVGIHNHVHLMYNTPGETEADVAALIAFIERWAGCGEVTLVPHRFLLEPGSLMARHPGRYGITRIEKAPLSMFERRQFVFAEDADGDVARVERRHERHREMLAPSLELIELEAARRTDPRFPFAEAM